SILCDRFSRLYHLESYKDVKVVDRVKWNNDRWEWFREPRGRHLGEVEELGVYYITLLLILLAGSHENRVLVKKEFSRSKLYLVWLKKM
nr:hypothetical protein [Tanacetum cinerariifolium]